VIDPPRWTKEQLEDDRAVAIEFFREERMKEPLERYLDFFDARQSSFEELLETLIDIDVSKIDDDTVLKVLSTPEMLRAFRYLSGPPISLDDLKVVSQTSIAPTNLRKSPDQARTIFKTVIAGLDRRRFPWVSEGREPTESEKNAAIIASAALMATQQTSTDRRNVSKELQEQSVFAELDREGLKRVPQRTIETLVDAPGSGEYCSESNLGGRKADVIVRLWDGRVLAIECKVSNSSVNSIKRLNNDAVAKAEDWIEKFGTRQIVPAAVLSGVFKIPHLLSAQSRGLTLFWAHKLETLTTWIAATN
jgi:hypothetical protein